MVENELALYSRVGTPLYLAPEIIKYEKYDFKADVWGAGCIAYILATLTHPF
jgi:serine/threonine protein kinase